MSEKKERQLNMEVLRIVAMLMIITLHYLDKGGVLKEFELKMGLNRNLAWIIEAFCMGSVNIYVLISGYFLSKSEFKFKKVIVLWAQILCYSWIITAIFAIVTKGAFNFANGIYDAIPLVLPVTGSHYWFGTVYILLYLFVPFLNKGIEAMDKKQFKGILIAAVAVFSLWNTILPFTQPLADREGMDICWFVCLYLIAAYIRKYPEDFKLNRWIYLLISAASAFLTFGLGKAILLVDAYVGKLGGYAKNFYPYNSLFILVASVCIFLFVLKGDLKAPKWLSAVILFASQGTFGVYLLHEHNLIKYRWPVWFGIEKVSGTPLFILHLIGTILAVFALGIAVDFVRRLIFGLFIKEKNKGARQ
ncbi:MAG: acyltransferase family protein [Lachnospiraceae bacterium]|nr:acyltransferase family protein [Lachnospiraceae bacterium]